MLGGRRPARGTPGARPRVAQRPRHDRPGAAQRHLRGRPAAARRSGAGARRPGTCSGTSSSARWPRSARRYAGTASATGWWSAPPWPAGTAGTAGRGSTPAATTARPPGRSARRPGGSPPAAVSATPGPRAASPAATPSTSGCRTPTSGRSPCPTRSATTGRSSPRTPPRRAGWAPSWVRSAPVTWSRSGARGRWGSSPRRRRRLLGADRVIVIDRYPERLRMAERHTGAETLHYEHTDVPAELRERSGGRGPGRLCGGGRGGRRRWPARLARRPVHRPGRPGRGPAGRPGGGARLPQGWHGLRLGHLHRLRGRLSAGGGDEQGV